MTRVVVLIAVLAITCVAGARDRVQPLWIDTDEPPPAAQASALGTIFRASGVAMLLCAAGASLLSRRREPDGADLAFEILSSKLELDHLDRELIRELSATGCRVAPVVLLVSQSALGTRVERFRRGKTDPGLRAHLHRLEAKLLA